jgi:hypothetical protein
VRYTSRTTVRHYLAPSQLPRRHRSVRR